VAIRDYAPTRDAAALRACFVELQEAERALEPGLPEAEGIAELYLARLHERCTRWQGRILVAEVAGEIAGFVSVWGRVLSEEPDRDPAPAAYVNDLVVRAPHRRRGLGRALMRAAEVYARGCGARWLGLGVLARNRGARALYDELGFALYHLQLRKPLA
jgi:ribosomal protein S18 acetylase RimI-like enzyme